MATLLYDTDSVESVEQGERLATMTGPLLVATDASIAADSAMRMARAIASRTGQDVIVVAVQPPLPMAAPEMQMAVPPAIERERVGSLRVQVLEQMERVGIDDDWQVQVVGGDPAATIVKAAAKYRAALVIMGLGQHGLFDRLLGDETVLRVLRLGTVPVLAAAPGFEDRPQRVLAATDFTQSSVRAATIAARVMQPGGSLTLAHVLARDVDPANWKTVNAGFQGTVGRAFDLAIANIGFERSETIERQVLAGDPEEAITELAEELQPDLIAVGSHGRNFLSRLLLGSVSQTMVRTARCSVLIAPPVDGPSFLDEVPEVTTRFASYEWSERLEEFTRRNTSRTATLEVIDPEIGAQVASKGFPFVGAAFDPRDGRVQIMIGGSGAAAAHLTRSIGGVTAVQVLRDRGGRDMLLRVAHGRGQTLLTLER